VRSCRKTWKEGNGQNVQVSRQSAARGRQAKAARVKTPPQAVLARLGVTCAGDVITERCFEKFLPGVVLSNGGVESCRNCSEV